jgi:hypothetical protein
MSPELPNETRLSEPQAGLLQRATRALSKRSYPLLHLACEVIDHSGHRAIAFDHLYGLIRSDLTARILVQTNDCVQSGPFMGMTLTRPTFWGDGDIGSFVVGLYEQELHQSLREIMSAGINKVLNVGCAGGLYAVGLARCLPDAMIEAFDIALDAGPFVDALATANGVRNRVHFRGGCDPERLAAAVQSTPAFILMDCEGYELDLVDPVRVPGLRECVMIIETHQVDGVSTEGVLLERLSPTHEIQIVSQGPRNPHCEPALRALSNLEQWLIVNENRQYEQTWLICRPHS